MMDMEDAPLCVNSAHPPRAGALLVGGKWYCHGCYWSPGDVMAVLDILDEDTPRPGSHVGCTPVMCLDPEDDGGCRVRVTS